MEDLTGKLCTLLCLLSGQRAQVVPALDTRFMVAEKSRYVFDVRKILKTTKPSKHIPPLEFFGFPEEENLCVVRCLDEYISRTHVMRDIVCMPDEEEDRMTRTTRMLRTTRRKAFRSHSSSATHLPMDWCPLPQRHVT